MRYVGLPIDLLSLLEGLMRDPFMDLGIRLLYICDMRISVMISGHGHLPQK